MNGLRRTTGRAAAMVALLVASVACSNSATKSPPKHFTIVGWQTNCATVATLPDDPIRAFGKPGEAPANDFFGARNAGASSTYQTIAGTSSTCLTNHDASVLWGPAMIVNGSAVRPLGVLAYYLLPREADPASVQPFPNGFAMEGTNVQWSCLHGGAPRRAAPYDCTQYGADHYVTAWVYFPTCWSGAGTDVVYAVNKVCPAGYPARLPYLTEQFSWPVLDGTTIAFSSGGPTTFHGGYINGWEEAAMDQLTRGCLNAVQPCGAVVNFFHRLGEGSPIPSASRSSVPTS